MALFMKENKLWKFYSSEKHVYKPYDVIAGKDGKLKRKNKTKENDHNSMERQIALHLFLKIFCTEQAPKSKSSSSKAAAKSTSSTSNDFSLISMIVYSSCVKRGIMETADMPLPVLENMNFQSKNHCIMSWMNLLNHSTLGIQLIMLTEHTPTTLTQIWELIDTRFKETYLEVNRGGIPFALQQLTIHFFQWTATMWKLQFFEKDWAHRYTRSEWQATFAPEGSRDLASKVYDFMFFEHKRTDFSRDDLESILNYLKEAAEAAEELLTDA